MYPHEALEHLDAGAVRVFGQASLIILLKSCSRRAVKDERAVHRI